MKFKKGFFSLIVALVLVISGSGLYNVADAEEQDSVKNKVATMTDKEKEKYYDEQTNQIENSYKVGEVLSYKDVKMLKAAAEFYKEQSKEEIQPSIVHSWNFYGTDRNSSLNIEGNIAGSATFNEGVWSHSVSVDGTVKLLRGAATDARMRLHVVTYGIVGSGGVIKTNDFWMSSGWISNDRATLDSTRSFTSTVFYANMDAYGELKNATGKLTIEDTVTIETD